MTVTFHLFQSKLMAKLIGWRGGLFHENYRFSLAGDEWIDRPMLLRLNKYQDTCRSHLFILPEIIDNFQPHD